MSFSCAARPGWSRCVTGTAICVRRRDDDLSRLDAVRADIAHARAYLRHHGQDDIDWGDLPAHRSDRPQLGLRARCSDRPVLHRGVSRRTFLRHSRRRARGPGERLHDEVWRIARRNHRLSSTWTSPTRAPRILADLRCAPHIPTDSFDCIILTQTLHVIDDVDAVLNECRRLLKPDGVMLATLPCASRVCLEYGADGDLWRMTPAGGRALFEKTFGAGCRRVHGLRQRVVERSLPGRSRVFRPDAGRVRRRGPVFPGPGRNPGAQGKRRWARRSLDGQGRPALPPRCRRRGCSRSGAFAAALRRTREACSRATTA